MNGVLLLAVMVTVVVAVMIAVFIATTRGRLLVVMCLGVMQYQGLRIPVSGHVRYTIRLY